MYEFQVQLLINISIETVIRFYQYLRKKGDNTTAVGVKYGIIKSLPQGEEFFVCEKNNKGEVETKDKFKNHGDMLKYNLFTQCFLSKYN